MILLGWRFDVVSRDGLAYTLIDEIYLCALCESCDEPIPANNPCVT
jgi:hypothetical protein